MKKIIAAAVAVAFVGPAMAADVSVGGLMEFYYQDNNGAKSTGFADKAIYIKAANELNNGLSIAASFNFAADGTDVTDDGGSSIAVSGPFGKLALGDQSNAVDAFDDRNDKDVVINAIGVSGADADVAWTLPTLMEGLTVVATYSPTTASDGADQDAGTGVGFSYTAGPLNVAYAQFDGDVAAEENNYIGATVTISGLAVNLEQMTFPNATGTTVETESTVGFTYSMGDTTLAVANETNEKADGSTAADIMFYGVKYSLGGGATLFAEMSSDDIAGASSDKTAVGVAYAF